ncbi:Oidioi.mRNA.OKI2018_I69.chr1.g1400.t1.cds [Oikopleura dioica]|uniref:Oidioi.mRNA.OKI2018_I69.chr1.g1400.t1.cds n=1 Tax=Oikopleura dioica TaxID=34765 RepID=A0ABN7SS16_OIKDI|nr:Oidioi.mRNA.OKI2018_I69.chr1.g1400.t1.cds [Oikopleura dioica]
MRACFLFLFFPLREARNVGDYLQYEHFIALAADFFNYCTEKSCDGFATYCHSQRDRINSNEGITNEFLLELCEPCEQKSNRTMYLCGTSFAGEKIPVLSFATTDSSFLQVESFLKRTDLNQSTLNLLNQFGQTALLSLACFQGPKTDPYKQTLRTNDYVSLLSKMIDLGADVEAKDKFGFDILDCGLLYHNIGVISAVTNNRMLYDTFKSRQLFDSLMDSLERRKRSFAPIENEFKLSSMFPQFEMDVSKRLHLNFMNYLQPENLRPVVDSLLSIERMEETFSGEGNFIRERVNRFQKSMDTFFNSPDSCSQDNFECYQLIAMASVLDSVVNSTLLFVDHYGSEYKFSEKIMRNFNDSMIDIIKLLLRIVENLEYVEYINDVRSVKVMTSVLRFLTPLLEKQFVKNWFLSQAGWVELNDLFHHFFEVEFIKDEKRRNNTLPAELIYAPIDGTRMKNTSDHSKLCRILFDFAEKCLMYDVVSLFEINRKKFAETGCDRNKLIQKSICLDRDSLKSLVAKRIPAKSQIVSVSSQPKEANQDFCGERTLRRRIQNAMQPCQKQDEKLLREKHLYLHPIKHLLKNKYIRLYGNLASFALIYNKEDLLVQFLSCDRAWISMDSSQLCITNESTNSWSGDAETCTGVFYEMSPLQLYASLKIHNFESYSFEKLFGQTGEQTHSTLVSHDPVFRRNILMWVLFSNPMEYFVEDSFGGGFAALGEVPPLKLLLWNLEHLEDISDTLKIIGEFPTELQPTAIVQLIRRIHDKYVNKSLDTGADLKSLENVMSILETIFTNGTNINVKICDAYGNSANRIIYQKKVIDNQVIAKWLEKELGKNASTRYSEIIKEINRKSAGFKCKKSKSVIIALIVCCVIMLVAAHSLYIYKRRKNKQRELDTQLCQIERATTRYIQDLCLNMTVEGIEDKFMKTEDFDESSQEELGQGHFGYVYCINSRINGQWQKSGYKNDKSGCRHIAAMNVVHRDIACRNIFISSIENSETQKFFIAKIGDFGMARKVDGTRFLISEASEQLPWRQCAPEVLSLPSKFSEFSDVWSFGILLWEAYSWGEQVFKEKTLAEMIEYYTRDFRFCQEEHGLKKPDFMPEEVEKALAAQQHFPGRRSLVSRHALHQPGDSNFFKDASCDRA